MIDKSIYAARRRRSQGADACETGSAMDRRARHDEARQAYDDRGVTKPAQRPLTMAQESTGEDPRKNGHQGRGDGGGLVPAGHG